jgi:cation diffusion facilitator CzcD-associated flavoprotein CzcO
LALRGVLVCLRGYCRDYRGHQPGFAGIEKFADRVVHSQLLTPAIDAANKRAVVIGSGAKAVTLLPSSPPAMSCSSRPATCTQRAGLAPPEIGRPSAQSRSIPSANPSSQLARRRQPNSR